MITMGRKSHSLSQVLHFKGTSLVMACFCNRIFLVCTLLKYDNAIWLPDPVAMNHKPGYHHSQNRSFFVMKQHAVPESI